MEVPGLEEYLKKGLFWGAQKKSRSAPNPSSQQWATFCQLDFSRVYFLLFIHFSEVIFFFAILNSIWDTVSQPGMEPRAPELEA